MVRVSSTISADGSSDRAAVVERALLHRYHVDGDLDARRELVERMLPFVRHIARRYANRSEPLEDLVQVGCVGLIKAVDRFDVDRGVRLSTFAAPNIAGEIKRHFRDRGWTIRVPRDIQELAAKCSAASERLTADLGRSPTVAELAAAVHSTEDAVLEALEGAQGYATVSFEEPIGDGRTALDLLGADDEAFSAAEQRVLIGDGLRVLEGREREIVRLRFVSGLTQREIADRIGISQMHVSRLIRRSLIQMREAMSEPAAAAA